MRRFLLLLTFLFLVFGSFVYGQEVDVTRYRTIDGTQNNLINPNWGAVGDNLALMVPLAYEDSMAAPAGADRPNPRILSNQIFSQSGLLNDPLKLSDFCWVWGQFIDHDFGLTPDGDEFMPIAVPRSDRDFDPSGTGAVIIPMLRNVFDPNTGTSTDNPRRHPNLITAFIDGSGVYGSYGERADWLRSFEGGKMKVSAGNLLPFNTTDSELDSPLDEQAPEMDDAVGLSEKHFVAGDVRANENPLLLSFHTLFVREHNRLAEELAKQHPDWDDQQLYLQARKINAGFIQSIVYNEYLPAMGVPLEGYQGYDPSVNPQVANLFTGAAFRLGHTLINSNIQRIMDDGTMHPNGPLSLQDVFFNPFVVMDEGGLDPLFKGMAQQMQQEFDARVVDDIRNFLFGHPGAGGLDLASINISRGRERGLPDLNSIRESLGLQRYIFFRQINSSNIQLSNQLRSSYLSINRVDPWVGLLAERRQSGSLFGETLLTILQHQFTALRDGDRFFYLNDPVLTDEEKEMITNITLHDIIMRNTNITLMQDNVFGAIPLDEICDNMTVEVLGNVRTEAGVPVSQVGVDLQAGTSFITNITNEEGAFNFAALPGCDQKTLQLYKVDDHDNGLSTLDLILVQMHILNRQMLDSPYKILAADVDMSGRISTLDLINMRKVILSIDLTLNDNTPWRFIPEDFEFTDPTNPFLDAIPGYMDMTQIGVDYNQNFVAVKLGDVNGSANPGSTVPQINELAPRSGGQTLQFLLEDQPLQAGRTYDIKVTAAGYKQLAGYQFGLRFDANALEIMDLNGQLDNLQESNFAVFNEEGFLANSWNTNGTEGLTLEDEQQIFTMRIQAKESGRLSEFLQLDQRQLKPEAYNGRLQTSAVQLRFIQANAFAQNFELYQNQPNPFQDNTSIRFFLPSDEQVDLTVFDASGRVVIQQRQEFRAGQQEWIVDQAQLSSGGVYYYRVATRAGAATKKMILTRD